MKNTAPSSHLLSALLLSGCVAAGPILLGCGKSFDEHGDHDPAIPDGGEAAAGGGGAGASGGGNTGGTTASGGNGGTTASGGSGGAGGTPCQQLLEAFDVAEDTQIVDGMCNGSIVYGDAPILNCGIGRLLLEFALSSDAAAAFADGRVVETQLTLYRVASHANCGGPCPATAGQLHVHPLRTDWVEGAGAYGGADWCRRTSGQPGDAWGAPGATAPNVDVWPESGMATITAAQADVAITLDPVQHETALSGNRLSLKVSPAAGATFVAGARENGAQAARLRVAYCLE
jgi:hypothetical protein